MHLHLGIDFVDNKSNVSNSHSINSSNSSMPNKTDSILVRKWGNESSQSGG